MDFKDIEKAAHEQGWRVRSVKKGWQFIPPPLDEGKCHLAPHTFRRARHLELP